MEVSGQLYSRNPFDIRLSGPQHWSGHGDAEKKSLLLPGIEL